MSFVPTHIIYSTRGLGKWGCFSKSKVDPGPGLSHDNTQPIHSPLNVLANKNPIRSALRKLVDLFDAEHPGCYIVTVVAIAVIAVLGVRDQRS